MGFDIVWLLLLFNFHFVKLVTLARTHTLIKISQIDLYIPILYININICKAIWLNMCCVANKSWTNLWPFLYCKSGILLQFATCGFDIEFFIPLYLSEINVRNETDVYMLHIYLYNIYHIYMMNGFRWKPFPHRAVVQALVLVRLFLLFILVVVFLYIATHLHPRISASSY